MNESRQSLSGRMGAEQAKEPLSGVRIGRVFGIEIGLDWSLAIIFGLIVVMLGTNVFPSWHPDWSSSLIWGLSILAAVLFFVSVLVHELSHAIVANRNDIPVRRLTLFLFGGVAHMTREPPSAKAEFKMAIVGPITSLLIGILATTIGTALAGGGGNFQTAEEAESFFRGLGPVESTLLWLGPINIVLAIFNMIPGFPLDGGRVLRAALWGATKDLRKATLWSSNIGRGFGWFLMAYGIFGVLAAGNLAALWWVFIGWFLSNAARASYTQLLMNEALEDVTVRNMMRRHPQTVAPEISLEELVQDHLMTSDQRAFPVTRDGQLVGLVTMADVRKVGRGEWSTTAVEQVMTPADKLATLKPEDDASSALRQLGTLGINQIPVADHGKLEGLVRREDVMKWLSLRGADRPARI